MTEPPVPPYLRPLAPPHCGRGENWRGDPRCWGQRGHPTEQTWPSQEIRLAVLNTSLYHLQPLQQVMVKELISGYFLHFKMMPENNVTMQ